MLQALLHGKRRGTTLEGRSLLFGEFDGTEDALTSSVFERLAYLDDSRITQVFSNLPGYPPELIFPGPLVKLHFWPRLQHPRDRGLVEPDVVIQFQALIVIIEAKRSDSLNTQRVSQLWREVDAVREEFKGLPLLMVALGGLGRSPEKDEHLTGETFDGQAALLLSTWEEFFGAVNALRDLNPSQSEKRILDDVREALRLHGVIHAEQLYFGTLLSSNIHFTRLLPLNGPQEPRNWASDFVCTLFNIPDLNLSNHLMRQLDD